ncbi:MAG: hypothetical protein IKW38_00270 [Kiritimatiellae bacterium]|nr:hypothetical protein [Kiritimatiellia bacterium]
MSDLEKYQVTMPFFEMERTREEIAQLTDEEIDRRYPKSTGANLKATNPQLYAVACRLYFEYAFSQREIAVMCRISRATVAAMVEAEQDAGTSVVQRKARLTRLRRLQEQTFARLEGLMANEQEVRRAGIVAVSQVWERIKHAGDELEQALNSTTVDASTSTAPSVTDAIHFLER